MRLDACWLVLAALSLSGCTLFFPLDRHRGGDAEVGDDAGTDAGPRTDAGPDAGAEDAGPPPLDAGSDGGSDAGVDGGVDPCPLPVGTGANALPGAQSGPELEANCASTSYVAYTAANAESDIQVMTWNGSAWLPVGPALSGQAGENAGSATLVLLGPSNPAVAWSERCCGGHTHIYARSWTGSSWASMGDMITNAPTGTLSICDTPTLAASPSGDALFLAWQGYDAPANIFQIHVRRWNGSAWDAVPTLDAVTATGTHAYEPAAVVGSDGTLYVAWSERPDGIGGAENIYVQKLESGAWTPIGGALDGSPAAGTSAFGATIALDGANPVVAWAEHDGTTAQHVHARRWNGVVWEALGTARSAMPGDTWAASPSIAIADGAPVVAWAEQSAIYVERWNGASWDRLAGPLTAAGGTAGQPRLVTHGANILVGWVEDGNIHLARLP